MFFKKEKETTNSIKAELNERTIAGLVCAFSKHNEIFGKGDMSFESMAKDLGIDVLTTDDIKLAMFAAHLICGKGNVDQIRDLHISVLNQVAQIKLSRMGAEKMVETLLKAVEKKVKNK